MFDQEERSQKEKKKLDWWDVIVYLKTSLSLSDIYMQVNNNNWSLVLEITTR